MPLFRKPRSPYFWYDFRFGGKRYRGSTEERTKAAARAFEAELITSLQKEGTMPKRGAKAPLLRDFLNQFLAYVDANQHLAVKTKRYYRNGARMLQETALREFPIDRITRPTVSAVKFSGSGSRANNAVRTLRAALSYGVELRLLSNAPTLQLYEERTREQTFSPQQEQDFLAVADETMADAFILLLDTGMRPDEACRFEWEWIDWARNLIRIPNGKTRAAERSVPISARLHVRLKRRAEEQQTSRWSNYRAGRYVFPSKKKGKHLSNFQDAFSRARAAANLPASLVLYSTRHTFGTDLAEMRDPKLTMVTMGHEDLKTTARYQHPQTERVATFIEERNAKRKSAATTNGHTFGHTSPTVN